MGEVIYQYDGSLEGFFCCVYECYAYKETPASFCCEDDPLSLYEVRTVITQNERSRRVQLGISGRSKKALALVRQGTDIFLPAGAIITPAAKDVFAQARVKLAQDH